MSTNQQIKQDIQRYGILFIAWLIVVLVVVVWYGAEANRSDHAEPETTIEVYRHYTVISHRNGSSSEASAIMVDSTFEDIACDAWEPVNQDGHNCVLLGHDSITEFLKLVNLDKIYTIRSTP